MNKDIKQQKTSSISSLKNEELDLTKDKLSIYKCILEDLEITYKKKNHDYGDSVGDTYKKYGDVSFLVRIEHKINRLRSLTVNSKAAKVKDEKVEDTLLDLVNYGILWLVEKALKEDDIVE